MISNTSKVLTPATTDGSRLTDRQHLGPIGGAQHAQSPHAFGVGDGTVDHDAPVVQQLLPVRHVLRHRLLFFGCHRLREIGARWNQPKEEEAHSAARVAGCTAISPKPLRRLHIAASSA